MGLDSRITCESPFASKRQRRSYTHFAQSAIFETVGKRGQRIYHPNKRSVFSLGACRNRYSFVGQEIEIGVTGGAGVNHRGKIFGKIVSVAGVALAKCEGEFEGYLCGAG
jgi:hypothetical protein